MMNDCSSRSTSSISSSIEPINSNNTCETSNNAKNKKLFPKKLWDLINDEKYYYCLRWSEDGQLVYLNRDEFEDSYLRTPANQFHTQKAISFVRQMNMYGFRKVDDCYYENDNFKRDCEHLLKNMIRKHPNKSQSRQQVPLQQQQQLINDDLLAPKQLLLKINSQASSLMDPHDDGAGLAANYGATNPLARAEHGLPDLGAFYALLSSLGNNLYSQPNYQGSLFEGMASALPQQLIYQGLLAQQDGGQLALEPTANAGTTTKDLYSHSGLASPIETPKWAPVGTSRNLLDRLTSATSLLAQSRANNGTTANDLSLKSHKNRQQHLEPNANGTAAASVGLGPRCSLLNGTCNSVGHHHQPEQAAALPMELARSRDHRLVRSFKRSVDSILDSDDSDTANNRTIDRIINPSSSKPKRTKRPIYHQQTNIIGHRQASFSSPRANELATNLVSEIAQSRDAHLDANVLLEASKYTEGFVQALFDTALLIARHSNGLNLSDYTPTADANCQPTREGNVNQIGDDAFGVGHLRSGCERSNISVDDLTSALRLLPSKLLKILQQ